MKISLKRMKLIWIPLVLVFPAFSFRYIWRGTDIPINEIIVGISKVSGIIFGVIQFIINQKHPSTPIIHKPSDKLHSRLYYLFMKVKPVLYPLCALVCVVGSFNSRFNTDPFTLVLSYILTLIPVLIFPIMALLNMHITFTMHYTLAYASVLGGFFSGYVILATICNLYSRVKSSLSKTERYDNLTARTEDIE